MDKILKTLVYNNEMTLSVLDTTDLVNKAIKIHKLSPLSAAALGRTLTVATFMASNLKNKEDKLSITISGDGVGGSIVVSGNSKLEMRGYIDNPRAELPLKPNGKLDVGGCVGKGKISVVKSMGLKSPYVGSCNLVSGEIGEDFTAYYTYSEQQPTAIAVGVKIGVDYSCVGAGAVIIQTLPNCSEEALVKAEEVMNNFTSISTLIKEMPTQELIKKYFGDTSDIEERQPKYKCICSRRYIEKLLISMGEKELRSIIKDEGKISINCQFCEKNYVFYEEDINKILGT